ncbi:MAG: hypothetical protein Q4F97_09230 [Bacteroidales bacterium]|nr:hypothetical protein [Bacteroidales bacterium]
MAKPLWQITKFLESKSLATEFDRDSQTLFVEESENNLQSRYYYDNDMEVLSSQCIYMKSLPVERYAELCKLANALNCEVGFGTFSIIDKEDLVFEINYLLDNDGVTISQSLLDKICMIPQEALSENLNLFLDVAYKGKTADEVMEY